VSGTGRIAMPGVDRMWLGSTVITALGPLTVPSRDDAVEAFTALAAAGPQARAGLRFAPGSTRQWVYRAEGLAEYAQSCVTQLPPGSDDDLDALLTRLTHEPRPARPARIFLADRHIVAMISHALGDGRLSLSLPSAVASYPATRALPDWATAPVSARPLHDALRHTFRDRASRSMVIAQRQAQRQAARTARVAARAEDEIGRPFEPQPVAVSEAGTAESARELRTWVRENLPGVAHFAALTSVTHQALIEHGIECAPGLHVLFDLRRYLPRGARTNGNFVGGLDLPVSAGNPRQITDTVAESAKAGHPLAAVAAAVVRGSLRRGAGPAESEWVPTRPRARLAMSYLGARSIDAGFPWSAGPEERMYWSRVDPAGPTGLTLLVAIVGRRVLLSASFHGSVFDAAAVRKALQASHEDPVGLIERAVGASARRTP
jgi:hypothetical protein